MQLTATLSYLLLALPSTVNAIFKDEVDYIDYHHQLVGLPQKDTTFFHRPRKADKASLLYTLSDVGVIGAINPSNGEVVWRQTVTSTGSASGSMGHLRAGDGENWICSAHGNTVQAWDATGGRNIWSTEFGGEVKDLEIMELTASQSKDVLVLLQEESFTMVRRLGGESGRVVWEYGEMTDYVPLQVSTSLDKVFIVGLHGTAGAYNLRIIAIDTATGSKVGDMNMEQKNDIKSEEQVLFVGSNSVSPIVAWVDAPLSTLKISILGTKSNLEIPLPADVTSVEIHAPHLPQSQSHFLVHTRTVTGNKGDVYHVDLKTNVIKHTYELPHLPGDGAFSTASIGANVYFTRITQNEVIVTSSMSHGVLGRWDLKSAQAHASDMHAVHAVSEAIKKSEDSYAVRIAVVTNDDSWVLVHNGKEAWSRPEGMTGGVAAVFAEIPESAALAHNLELEAHSNPIRAFLHRLIRHSNSLQRLPEYLIAIPDRLIGSVLGSEAKVLDPFTRDSFGFHKLVVLATKRGQLYCLDTGNKGNIVWHTRPYVISTGETWEPRGMFVEEEKQQVTVRGAKGEQAVVGLTDGRILEASAPGSWPPVESAVVVDSSSGQWLISVGRHGKIGDIPVEWQPKERLAVRGDNGEIKGLVFDGKSTKEVETWSFVAPSGYKILKIATRNQHEQIASIGRVLGDRSVLYKYLNSNTIVVAAGDETTSVLMVYLIDTLSGQVLSSSRHTGIDISKPVECAMAENWFICSLFGQFILQEDKSQSIKGWQIIVNDMYESELPNYRGPLEEAANFSSLNPIDSPTSPPFPHIVSQAYVVGAPLSALTVSQTRQGIATRQLLGYVADTHSIIGIPRPILEPRRPVGRDPDAAEKEEGLTRYLAGIEMDPRLMITHERDVIGVEEIMTCPATLESTSLVFAYGVDVFGTRVTPSLSFDVLGKGFNKVTLIMTVVALFAGVLVVGPMVRKKQINLGWGGIA